MKRLHDVLHMARKGPLGAVAGLLVLAIALVVGAVARHMREPVRILLLDPIPVGGVTASEAEVLTAYFADALEGQGRVYVLRRGLPVGTLSGGSTSGRPMLVVRLHPRRVGDLLDPGLVVQPLEPGSQAPVPPAAGEPSAPAEALRKACAQLSSRLSHVQLEALVPRTPAVFWKLVALDARGREAERLSMSIAEAQALASEGQGRPEVQFLLGDLLMARSGLGKEDAFKDRQAAMEAITRATEGPVLLPRAWAALVSAHVESGQVRRVLEPFLDVLREHPDSRHLLNAANYAGRTTGLLDLAQAAVRHDRRLGQPLKISLATERASLYAGDMEAFRLALEQDVQGVGTRSLLDRGRLALMLGHRMEAATCFRQVQSLGGGTAGALADTELARAFGLVLEGRSEEAVAGLDTLKAHHYDGRAPDGEDLLTLAEAYDLAGREDLAFQVAERAVAAGFTCLSWFGRNPLLEGVRNSVRWPSLRQSLEERERILRRRFPADAWAFLGN